MSSQGDDNPDYKLEFHFPPPAYQEKPSEDDSPTRDGMHALDVALAHIAVAVAALYRAGPFYTCQSEQLWFFTAGSWTKPVCDSEVETAKKLLPKRESVAQDVLFAESNMREAVEVLWSEGDARDAKDLLAAILEYKAGSSW